MEWNVDEELIPCVTAENIIFYIGVLGFEYFFSHQNK